MYMLTKCLLMISFSDFAKPVVNMKNSIKNQLEKVACVMKNVNKVKQFDLSSRLGEKTHTSTVRLIKPIRMIFAAM